MLSKDNLRSYASISFLSCFYFIVLSLAVSNLALQVTEIVFFWFYGWSLYDSSLLRQNFHPKGGIELTDHRTRILCGSFCAENETPTAELYLRQNELIVFFSIPYCSFLRAFISLFQLLTNLTVLFC